jgi:hypothetical protein
VGNFSGLFRNPVNRSPGRLPTAGPHRFPSAPITRRRALTGITSASAKTTGRTMIPMRAGGITRRCRSSITMNPGTLSARSWALR